MSASIGIATAVTGKASPPHKGWGRRCGSRNVRGEAHRRAMRLRPNVSHAGSPSSGTSRTNCGAPDGELEIHYQPVMDPSADDTVAGVEALVRAGTTPAGARSSPETSLPLAEETGLIVGRLAGVAPCHEGREGGSTK